jgi:enoyl-CoA hydratase/carnithine racemase
METFEHGIPDVTGIFDCVEKSHPPTLCAVQGAAIGLGLILAMAADIRIVTEQAKFSAPEVKIGLFAPRYLTTRLERLVGLAAAREMCLTGDIVNGAEAHRIGLANHLVPAESLFAETQALAERIAALPSLAVQTTKAVFGMDGSQDLTAWEQQKLQLCWESPEREAAMIAFLTRDRS